MDGVRLVHLLVVLEGLDDELSATTSIRHGSCAGRSPVRRVRRGGGQRCSVGSATYDIAQAACACAGAGGGASANPNPNQGSWAASAGKEAGGETGGMHCVKRRTYPSSVHCASCRALWRPPFHGENHGTQSRPPLAVSPPRTRLTVRAISSFFTITHTRPSRTTHTHAHKHSATHVTHTIYVGDDNATCDAAPYEILADARDGVRCMAVGVRARLPTTRRDRQGARGRPARARRGRLRNI